MSLSFALVQKQQNLPCSNEKIIYQHVFTAAWKAMSLLKQGSYRSWKTLKVLEFKHFIFQAWKVMECNCWSWKVG